MTPFKISKAAQGTLVFVFRLQVSNVKQLFTFSNIVLCHLMLSLLPPPLSSLHHLHWHSLSSSTYSPNHKCALSRSHAFTSHVSHMLLSMFSYRPVPSPSSSYSAHLTFRPAHNTPFAIRPHHFAINFAKILA